MYREGYYFNGPKNISSSMAFLKKNAVLLYKSIASSDVLTESTCIWLLLPRGYNKVFKSEVISEIIAVFGMFYDIFQHKSDTKNTVSLPHSNQHKPNEIHIYF